jgi:long-chain acyl-CoA synthetase
MLKENFVQTIEKSIRENWNQNSLSDFQGNSFKYSDVGLKVLYLQKILAKTGIHQGDKVSLIGRNSANWCMAYLATITFDAVTVPILPDFIATDITNIVNHSDSTFIFAADTLFESIDKAQLKNIKAVISLNTFMALYVQNDQVKQQIEEAKNEFEQEKDTIHSEQFTVKSIPNDHLAVISYTSGTTGFSKGVMLTFNSLMANVRYAQNNMPLQAGDNIVSFLPLAHSFGVAFEFLFPFSIGCHITFLTKTPSIPILLQAFAEKKPRLVLTVPLIVEKIYKNQIVPAISKGMASVLIRIPLLRRIVYKKIHSKISNVFGGNFHEIVIGGAAFNPDAELFLKKIGFPFTIGYGMTECGPLISYASWDTTRIKAAGRPVDTLDVKIDSPDPENIAGEILVKGDNVMLGYYKNQEATSKVLLPDGWLRTGDLGVMDKQHNIYIKGRSKSMILGPSGQNIYPEEIEARINSLKYIAETVVVERDHRIVALIGPDREALQKDGVSDEAFLNLLEEYKKEINRELPNFMNVAEFSLHADEFEKTPKRSIKRYMYS